jgi:hypothetical protein
MTGGIAFAVHLITHPPGETAQFVTYPLWVPSHVLGGIASLLIALGLVGLYALQSKEAGVSGFIGFVLTFVALVLSAGALIFLSGIVIPFLVEHRMGPFVDPKGPLLKSPTAQVTVALTAFCLLVGLISLAIATLRARVLPQLGSWLVISVVPFALAGLVLVLIIGTSFQGVIQTLLGIWIGVGMFAWGWALWSHKTETAQAANSPDARPEGLRQVQQVEPVAPPS